MNKDDIISFDIENNKIIINTNDGETKVYDYNVENLKNFQTLMQDILNEIKSKHKITKLVICLLNMGKNIVYLSMFACLFCGLIFENMFIQALQSIGYFACVNVGLEFSHYVYEKYYYDELHNYNEFEKHLNYIQNIDNKNFEKHNIKNTNSNKISKNNKKIKLLQNLKDYLCTIENNQIQEEKGNVKTFRHNNLPK